MEINEIITLLYPEKQSYVDFLIRDNGDGLFIAYWNAESMGEPEPTPGELKSRINAIDNAVKTKQRIKDKLTTAKEVISNFKKSQTNDIETLTLVLRAILVLQANKDKDPIE